MFSEFWEEYTHLITDPAHLALEFTIILMVDVILIGLAWPFIKKLIRKHDRDHHGID